MKDRNFESFWSLLFGLNHKQTVFRLMIKSLLKMIIIKRQVTESKWFEYLFTLNHTYANTHDYRIHIKQGSREVQLCPKFVIEVVL